MDPEAELESFVVKFTDPIAREIRANRAAMRALLPGALELVYDNYNALAIGYSPSEKASDMVFSIAAYPRWVSLFLVGGPLLIDPDGLLKGAGATMRHVVLTGQNQLGSPAVRDLMAQAIRIAGDPFDPAKPSRTIIKSISAKQRSRKP